jgi:tungstate transport system ATP-binding protein
LQEAHHAIDWFYHWKSDITSSMQTIIRVEGLLAAQGGAQVLSVSELEVGRGQILAVLGPNGSGKTTLLLCLAGLLEPTGGRIFFKSEEIVGRAATAKLRRQVTLAFQEPLLFDSLVSANIESGLRLRRISKALRKEMAAAAAELFGISCLLGRSARKLSGGESQRVSLARAFAIGPELILLDEPFSALDAPTKRPLMSDLGRILKESGTAAVFSTHDINEAVSLASHIAVLNEGRLVQAGEAGDVVENPADDFVAGMVVPGEKL